MAIPAPASSELRDLVARSRALGADSSLVINGGGNTSSKGIVRGADGVERRVLWVKASGADLAIAGEADFPALWVEELLPLRGIDHLDDPTVIDHVRAALVAPGARRPSIETLMHAFLPFAHIDHVHADAVCALTNGPHPRDAVRDALGERFAYVDWIRPGFGLAQIVADLEAFDGVVLAHHGLVTWADESDACLRRTLETVEKARAFLVSRAAAAATPTTSGPMPALSEEDLRGLLLHLRGALSGRGLRVLHVDERLRDIADRADLPAIVAGGVSSADHMLWIKPRSLALPADARGEAIHDAVAGYAAGYAAYYDAQRPAFPEAGAMHDPAPRVVLVPGVGAVVAGANLADARRAANVAIQTHRTAAVVRDAFGEVVPMTASAAFEFDYWPMELYKLTLQDLARPFAGTIQIVTGAASGIGRTIAVELAAAGASVVAADLDAAALATLPDQIRAAGGPEPALVTGDQSSESVVAETVNTAVRRFGGLDGVVINAGIAVAANLEELEVERWDQALAVNLTSAFILTREAMKVMRTQGRGGAIVYNASKNAFAPSPGFGAYSVTKAGMLQLMRIAALEGGSVGIRCNAVNPDAVFDNSRLWADGVREERAAAHGIKPDELEAFYAKRNMLHRQVTTHDVAAAVMFLLSPQSSRTTGCVIPVDGGVAAAFPR